MKERAAKVAEELGLSDEHEGAKVRCPECARVFVARPSGSKGASSKRGPNTGLLIGAFVGILALMVVLYLARPGNRQGPVTKAAVAEEATPAPLDYGWNSELVRVVVSMHEAAFAGDRERLKSLLHASRVWARENTGADGHPDPSVPAFDALPPHERVAAQERWAIALTEGPDREQVPQQRQMGREQEQDPKAQEPDAQQSGDVDTQGQGREGCRYAGTGKAVGGCHGPSR